MDESRNVEHIPHLELDHTTAQRMVEDYGDTIYSETDTAIRETGEEIIATAGEIRLQTVEERQQTDQYFDRAKQMAQTAYSTEKSAADVELEKAISALRARHSEVVGQIDENYRQVGQKISTRKATAEVFLQQCDDLSQAMAGAWQVYKTYHRLAIETNVRAASELTDERERLDQVDTETTDLGQENKVLYDEYGACMLMIESLRQQRLAVFAKSREIDQRMERERQAIFDMTPESTEGPIDPEAAWSNVDMKWNPVQGVHLQEAQIIGSEMTRATLENERREHRAIEIHQRIEKLKADRPTITQRIDELVGLIHEMSDLTTRLREGVATVAADIKELKVISQHILNDQGEVSPDMQAWLKTTLAKHQAAVEELPQIVEDRPPTDPVSLASIRFDDTTTYRPAAATSEDRPGKVSEAEGQPIEEVREIVRGFVGRTLASAGSSAEATAVARQAGLFARGTKERITRT